MWLLVLHSFEFEQLYSRGAGKFETVHTNWLESGRCLCGCLFTKLSITYSMSSLEMHVNMTELASSSWASLLNQTARRGDIEIPCETDRICHKCSSQRQHQFRISQLTLMITIREVGMTFEKRRVSMHSSILRMKKIDLIPLTSSCSQEFHKGLRTYRTIFSAYAEVTYKNLYGSFLFSAYHIIITLAR